ncbi:MAG: hypothetical protein ACR2KZ_09610, partial [Segetibacter sp.]
MDIRLLIEENFHAGLTLISSNLYHITENKSEIWFHDENCYNLFFIHLNEYVNTEFISPLDNKSKHSLFELTMEFPKSYCDNDYFKKFVSAGNSFKDFLDGRRIYDKYISPYEIKIETSFAELINIQANYIKHSLYHLSKMKNKLKRMFKINGIENIPDDDYNEHLQYFKEAVLDDRLNFNQTKIVEEVGKYFLALYNLVHSDDNIRIRLAIDDWILQNGRTSKWNIEQPKDMTDGELFHWEIKGLSCWRFDKTRLTDLIPTTAHYL